MGQLFCKVRSIKINRFGFHTNQRFCFVLMFFWLRFFFFVVVVVVFVCLFFQSRVDNAVKCDD